MLRKSTVAMVVGGFMALLTSCAVTTRSTEGTSETFQNTTDATTDATGTSSDFTSSTSPRDEGTNAEARKVKVFASVNLDRLKEDMARGGGEHLTAFAHLLGIREGQQPAFFTLTRQNYGSIFNSEPTTADQMLVRLSAKLEEHPELRTLRQ
jgi:hypothetical protein